MAQKKQYGPAQPIADAFEGFLKKIPGWSADTASKPYKPTPLPKKWKEANALSIKRQLKGSQKKRSSK